MALTTIVFGPANSGKVDRGFGGPYAINAILPKPTAWVSPNYFGGYWAVSETFKDSANANVPDGTVVRAFHGTTHALVGSGTTTAGVAALQVATNAPVYLVAALAGGETVRTTAVTPA